METLAFSLAYALPALAAAIAVGMIGAAAQGALARNPEKLSDIRTLMILAIVFAEALAIIGIIVAILTTVFVS